MNRREIELALADNPPPRNDVRDGQGITSRRDGLNISNK